MARKASSVFRTLLVATLALAAAPAWAASLSEAQVRAFLAGQERAWNAGRLDAYFATFRPDARFTHQYRTPAGEVVPYGRSTLQEARAQNRRFRATSKVSETSQVLRIAVGADGRSAEVLSRVVSRIETANGVRITCAQRRQALALAGGRLRATAQTDTFMRCPR